METYKIISNPMEVATHIGIDESGKVTMKVRVIHDISFPSFVWWKSVNSRTIEHSLEPIMFGLSLSFELFITMYTCVQNFLGKSSGLQTKIQNQLSEGSIWMGIQASNQQSELKLMDHGFF